MLAKSAKASVEYLKMAEERRSKLAALLAGRIIKSLHAQRAWTRGP